jgi:hypothetical protein
MAEMEQQLGNQLSRLIGIVEQVDKRLANIKGLQHDMLSGWRDMNNRLDRKADRWVVVAGISGLGILITVLTWLAR